MLTIVVPDKDFYDENKNEFITIKGQKIQLEHSLVSISKWESKWHKSFLKKNNKTREELLDYVRCMTITQNVRPEVYYLLTDNNIEEINRYIEDPMTATYFPKESKGGSGGGDTVTSELIYYWMTVFNIPVEFQKWHINRLLTLIKICERKSGSNKNTKISKSTLAQRRALNEQRKAMYNTTG